jgi:glycosyltransferase involved in cell wall biosynthesis
MTNESRIPLISVVMPAYNAESTIESAIDSLLEQTFDNFELIVVDDCSTDKTSEIIASYGDSRIFSIRNSQNLGLAASLNVGIKAAKAELVARQDADDVSKSDRLQKQFAVISQSENTVLVGTWAKIVSEKGQDIGRLKHPYTVLGVRAALLFRNPLVHSSVLFRKWAYEESGGYTTDPELQPPEDFELWTKMICLGEIVNIPEYLVDYLHSPAGISKTKTKEISIRMQRLVLDNFVYILDAPLSTSSTVANYLYPENLQTRKSMKGASLLALEFDILKLVSLTLKKYGFSVEVQKECGRLLLSPIRRWFIQQRR